MNIGLFTDSYFPEISGLATSIKVLRQELKKRGHNVYIFTTSNPNDSGNHPGVFRLPSMPLIFLKSRRLGLFYTPKAAKGVKHLKLDIIHTQTEFSLGIFGKIMAKQLGIPVVHTCHTMYKDYVHYISKGKFQRFTNNFVKVVSRKLYNDCDAIVVPTLKVYDLLRDYGVNKTMKIIPTGIELDRFASENYSKEELLKLRKSYGLTEEDPVIVYIGRIAKEKSIDVIINQMPKVLKKLPNAKLLIVGKNTETDSNELIELVMELKLEKAVVFAGEQPWEQIGKFYRLGDVFVSASLTETQGLTLIEAMASDIPVVARNDRNIEELIQDYRNGRIFDAVNELPGILIEVLSNKELAESFVTNARTTVEEYSAKQFGNRIENLYYKVLEHTVKAKKKSYNGLKSFRNLKLYRSYKKLNKE
jgi:1,2-diacylglycerol 3-alpha-glucosyltransferase